MAIDSMYPLILLFSLRSEEVIIFVSIDETFSLVYKVIAIITIHLMEWEWLKSISKCVDAESNRSIAGVQCLHPIR